VATGWSDGSKTSLVSTSSAWQKNTAFRPKTCFDALVNQVPPGSDGLVLQPYWSPGLRHPGPEARGSVVGFNDVHTRSHLYRAILEGLAYALREGAERTCKRSGVDITELRVAGGGSQSNAAMQLTADIFGLPAARPHVYEASGLGAAIDAAVGAGIHTSFASAVNDMTRTGDLFEPNPAAHHIYDELYEGLFKDVQAAATLVPRAARHPLTLIIFLFDAGCHPDFSNIPLLSFNC
jgi:sugar (pentulose or hexulose) kinase